VNIQAQEILAAITEKLSDLGNCPTHGTKKQQDEWATEGSGVLSDIRNQIDKLQSLIAQHPHKAKKVQQVLAEIEAKKKPLLAKVSEIMFGA
jgi:MoxR-like ATPase